MFGKESFEITKYGDELVELNGKYKKTSNIIKLIEKNYKHLYENCQRDGFFDYLQSEYDYFKKIIIEDKVVGLMFSNVKSTFLTNELTIDFYYVLQEYRDKFSLYDEYTKIMDNFEGDVSFFTLNRDDVVSMLNHRYNRYINNRFIIFDTAVNFDEVSLDEALNTPKKDMYHSKKSRDALLYDLDLCCFVDFGSENPDAYYYDEVISLANPIDIEKYDCISKRNEDPWIKDGSYFKKAKKILRTYLIENELTWTFPLDIFNLYPDDDEDVSDEYIPSTLGTFVDMDGEDSLKENIINKIKENYPSIYDACIDENYFDTLESSYTVFKDLLRNGKAIGFLLGELKKVGFKSVFCIESYYVLPEYRDDFSLFHSIIGVNQGFMSYRACLYNPKREDIELLIDEGKAEYMDDRFVFVRPKMLFDDIPLNDALNKSLSSYRELKDSNDYHFSVVYDMELCGAVSYKANNYDHELDELSDLYDYKNLISIANNVDVERYDCLNKRCNDSLLNDGQYFQKVKKLLKQYITENNLDFNYPFRDLGLLGECNEDLPLSQMDATLNIRELNGDEKDISYIKNHIKENYGDIYDACIEENFFDALASCYDVFKEIVIEDKVVGFMLFTVPDEMTRNNYYAETYFVLSDYRDNFSLVGELDDASSQSGKGIILNNPKSDDILYLIDDYMAYWIDDRFVFVEQENRFYSIPLDKSLNTYINNYEDLLGENRAGSSIIYDTDLCAFVEFGNKRYHEISDSIPLIYKSLSPAIKADVDKYNCLKMRQNDSWIKDGSYFEKVKAMARDYIITQGLEKKYPLVDHDLYPERGEEDYDEWVLNEYDKYDTEYKKTQEEVQYEEVEPKFTLHSKKGKCMTLKGKKTQKKKIINLLKNKYRNIFDVCKINGVFDSMDKSYDFFKEIVIEEEVVGFMLGYYRQGFPFEHFCIEKLFVFDEYEDEFSLAYEFFELKEAYGYTAVIHNPKREDIEYLISKGDAHYIDDRFVFTELLSFFEVFSMDEMLTRVLDSYLDVTRYDLAAPSVIYDMELCCAVSFAHKLTKEEQAELDEFYPDLPDEDDEEDAISIANRVDVDGYDCINARQNDSWIKEGVYFDNVKKILHEYIVENNLEKEYPPDELNLLD